MNNLSPILKVNVESRTVGLRYFRSAKVWTYDGTQEVGTVYFNPYSDIFAKIYYLAEDLDDHYGQEPVYISAKLSSDIFSSIKIPRFEPYRKLLEKEIIPVFPA